jgi:uncharacterized protein YdiU (UPF0061 family)
MPTAAPDSTVLQPDLAWNHSFAALGEEFFVPLAPTPLPDPYWVGHNAVLGAEIGLPSGWWQTDDWLAAFTGNRPLDGARSLASVYSGHQFGVWAGQLGDGRAILLGEAGGLELQLKGAGLTPFSRMGDGRAVLRSSIREFLCSEAMHGLGIPTTRALCVTGSDERVLREEVETAAVVTRVAPSFIRFGHFEHFSHSGQHEQLRKLADYVIDRFYPDCRSAEHWSGNPYVAFLAAVTRRTAEMVAQWQAVGFCHGVMNTDNMSILGLTIDYGPFQFLDGYNPAHICNHSDHQGRYAFYKQPNIAYWNLFCLGQALLPLADDQDEIIAALETYKVNFPQALHRRFGAKLGFAGVAPMPSDGAKNLIERVLGMLAAERVDFTIFWARLSQWMQHRKNADSSVRDLFLQPDAFDQWISDYQREAEIAGGGHNAAKMLRINPRYVLRNHLGELAIRAARKKDFSVVANLLKVLHAPYDQHQELCEFADFPPDWAGEIAISCSS